VQVPLVVTLPEASPADGTSSSSVTKQGQLGARPAATNGARFAGWKLVAAGVGAAALLVAGAVFLLKASPRNEAVSAPATTPSASPTTPGPFPTAEPASKPWRWTAPSTEKPALALDAEGHSGAIKHAFLLLGNTRAVTVSLDKTVRFWDVASGDTLSVLRLPFGPGDGGQLEAAALSPDGQMLAVAGVCARASQPAPIYLIACASEQLTRIIKGTPPRVESLAFAPDGRTLAAGGSDNTVRLYDVASGVCGTTLKEHVAPVAGIAFAPDGKRLVAVARENIYVWSVTTGKREAVWTPALTVQQQGETIEESNLREGMLPINVLQVTCAAWSPDGKLMATSGNNGNIRLHDAAGKRLKNFNISYPLSYHSKVGVTSLMFTPDSQGILYTGIDNRGAGSAGIVDLASGKTRVEFVGPNDAVLAGSYSSPDGMVIHRVRSYITPAARGGHLSADGTWAISASGSKSEACIWRTADGSLVQQFGGRGRDVWRVHWSNDGKTIAWGHSPRGKDGAPRPLERTFALDKLEFGDAPAAADFPAARRGRTRNGTYLVERTPSGDILYRGTLSDLRKPSVTFKPDRDDDTIFMHMFMGNNRVVAAARYGLYLIDVETMKPIRRFAGHTGAVLDVALSPDERYIISGSADQTVRIWDPEKDEPLLSLFLADADWVAWTADGYYAASAGGEHLMGWQVSNGQETPATYYPAAQFRKSLYRPDVIKRVVQAGSVAQAVALARAPVANIGQMMPPLAAVTFPPGPSGYKFSGTTLQVKGAARSVGQHPVTALRLLVDGRPFGGEKGRRVVARQGPGDVEASWNVDLPPGKHVLAVQAESAVSKGTSPYVEVTNTVGADQLPNLYVLAVGINDYPGALQLSYAAKDADVITRTLGENGARLFHKTEVKLLKDRQATRKDIEQGLAWLQSRMTARDVGMVFFSGHGATDEAGSFYLVPVDVNVHDLPGSCLSGTRLKQALGDMPGRLIAVLDACHSGAAGSQPRRVVADELIRDLISDEYGVIVMSSSLSTEVSLESPAVAHGFFTLALVEALSGRADRNRDGLIFLNELDW